MKIKEQDFYYGAALSQISEYASLATVSKVKGEDGLFRINKDKHLLIRYSTADEGEWRFSLRNFEDGGIARHFNFGNFYIALVCGGSTICLLTEADLAELIDPLTSDSQWISVSFDFGKQMQVNGTKGHLRYKIPHNAFPKNIFERSNATQEEPHWPPLSQVRVYENQPALICSSENRTINLADMINSVGQIEEQVDMFGISTVYVSLSSLSSAMGQWNDANLSEIETKFLHAFNSISLNVSIERLTTDGSKYGHIGCDNEFFWMLEISRKPEEDATDEQDIADENDPIYNDALEFVLSTQKASPSAIQRKFSIEYKHAAQIVEAMETAGVVGAMKSNGKRDILI